jgi:hypothetical protein
LGVPCWENVPDADFALLPIPLPKRAFEEASAFFAEAYLAPAAIAAFAFEAALLMLFELWVELPLFE